MLKNFGLTTCVLASLSFAGCATMDNPSTVKNLGKLQNTQWILSEINGVKIATEKTSTVPTIQFDEQRVSGSDGCNRFTGGYVVKAQNIELSQMASTAMACLSTSDLPQKFGESLSQVKHYDASNSELKLMDGNKKTILKFSAEK